MAVSLTRRPFVPKSACHFAGKCPHFPGSAQWREPWSCDIKFFPRVTVLHNVLYKCAHNFLAVNTTNVDQQWEVMINYELDDFTLEGKAPTFRRIVGHTFVNNVQHSISNTHAFEAEHSFSHWVVSFPNIEVFIVNSPLRLFQ